MKLKRWILLTYILLNVINILKSQIEQDTILEQKFGHIMSAMVSDDESILVIITNDNYFEFLEMDSFKLINRIKASRNAWLDKAFFIDNKVLYYDYGTQMKTKYKKLDIISGEKQKVDCWEVPKRCSYYSLKCCNYQNKLVALKTRPFILKEMEGVTSLYKIKDKGQ